MYAVLELVNNSLRAHREADVGVPIEVRFHIHPGVLRIDVIDRGGGFDPARLPFNLHEPIKDLDLNGESFLRYRALHNNTRFGMGLFIAKRFFHEFELRFINEAGEVRDWGNDDIAGTHITLLLRIGDDVEISGQTADAKGEMLREVVLP